MQEVFEKILEKMEELKKCGTKHYEDGKYIYTSSDYDHGTLNKTIEIVKQKAEQFGTDTNVGSNGWIPCSERLPEKNGYYYVTQIVKSISTGKKIAIEKAHVEFSEGKWRRAKHLEVIAWLDIEPYQPKGE